MHPDYKALREARLATLSPRARAVYVGRQSLRGQGVEGMRARGRAAAGPPSADPDIPYHDVMIPGPAGPIPTRIYVPGGPGPKGVYLHVHAGGYISMGGLDTMVSQNLKIAKDSGCVVVAPDFRLPPEHVFPAPIDDCFAVLEWTAANARTFGGDPDHIGVGGGCTGGSISAVIALMARDRGGPKVACQYLRSTVFDCRTDYPSYVENGEGYTLDAADARWVTDLFLGDPENRWDWRASPVLAPSVRGVAPTLIWVGEWDILRDEGVAYANRLREAGVPVTLVVHPKESHGVGPDSAVEVARQQAEFLRNHLTPRR